MNPGEENHFDGLLRNKFSGFEADPGPQVWHAVSQTLPQANPSLLSRALPFGLGTMFGMAVSFGLVVGYQQVAENHSPAAAIEASLPLAKAVPPATPTAKAIAGPSATTPATARPATEEAATGTPAARHTRINTRSYHHTRHYTASQHQQSTRAAGATAAAPRTQSAGRPMLSTDQAPEMAATQGQPARATTGAASATAAIAPSGKLISTVWLIGHELDTAIAQVLTPASAPAAAEKQERLKELLRAQGTVLAVLQNRNDSLLSALNDADLDSSFARVRIAKPRKHQSSIKAPIGWSAPSKWALAFSYEATPQWGSQTIGPEAARAVEKVRGSRSADIRIRNRVNDRLSLTAGLGLTRIESEMNFSRSQTMIDSVTFIIDQHQYLRPNHTFVNVPVAMHYKVGGYGHFGVGISLGAQTHIYQSGTRPEWTGNQYELVKANAASSPFRQVSLALNGGLDLNYRITPRLTAQAGPTLRYWAISPYRQASNGFSFLPGMQLGISLDL